jgi:hypothetical protein
VISLGDLLVLALFLGALGALVWAYEVSGEGED